MTHSPDDSYHVTGHPTLALDGVTIRRRYGGRTEDGSYYDGWDRIVPGDPHYDELLPQARRHPEGTRLQRWTRIVLSPGRRRFRTAR
ncbi:hypothetical protein [Streptomyces sp. NRRL S-350]|uniref:hypothetical protein n=1 Tax=Streptomyces sp. NRRL S-350 TaxID=1463902 RepID=UPI000B2EC44D|nr:hypothetical protein [Streptomyces sp. NRRL S-350]